jgi:hypothetical protein
MPNGRKADLDTVEMEQDLAEVDYNAHLERRTEAKGGRIVSISRTVLTLLTPGDSHVELTNRQPYCLHTPSAGTHF